MTRSIYWLHLCAISWCLEEERTKSNSEKKDGSLELLATMFAKWWYLGFCFIRLVIFSVGQCVSGGDRCRRNPSVTSRSCWERTMSLSPTNNAAESWSHRNWSGEIVSRLCCHFTLMPKHVACSFIDLGFRIVWRLLAHFLWQSSHEFPQDTEINSGVYSMNFFGWITNQNTQEVKRG